MKIKNKEKNLILIENVSQFCKENNFSRSSFDKMLKGKIENYEGYQLAN